MQRTIVCALCGVDFTYDFVSGPSRLRCPPCDKQRQTAQARRRMAEWRVANPARARESYTKTNRARSADPEFRRQRREAWTLKAYGLTPQMFQALLEAQGGGCAICGGPPNGPGDRLHVDHCHNSNKVRGLLCGKCNTAVGLLDDNPERAEALARYLRS